MLNPGFRPGRGSRIVAATGFTPNFQQFQSVDISMPGDAEATLPPLIDAVKSAIGNDRKDAMAKRGDGIRRAHMRALQAAKEAAAIAWNAQPVSTARLLKAA
jgi:acetolactate synthase I/II/III large subunit